MTELDKYVADELEKYAGQSFPLKAGPLTRMMVKKADCTKLHPNPDDEFCFPDVGPSYRIIAEYEKKYTDAAKHGQTHVEEPIIVEKMYPDGYMIINGHHRWAAAMRMGVKQIPVKVVNLAHESDIDSVINSSENERRVTFDLDEVLFVNDDRPAEKGLPFPFNCIYKERLRNGAPGLLNYLIKNRYDIWVYSAKYYSIDYIRAYFKKYHADVTGIVTGTAKKNTMGAEAKKRVAERIATKYTYTIHVDNDTILKTTGSSKEFEDYNIGGSTGEWSKKIIEVIGGMK